MFLPSKSKVNSESYSWRIENFSVDKFRFYETSKKQSKTHGVKGLRSPEFALYLMNDGDLKKVKLCLWLTQDASICRDDTCKVSSPWLKLSLSQSDSRPPKSDESQQAAATDTRHMCKVFSVTTIYQLCVKYMRLPTTSPTSVAGYSILRNRMLSGISNMHLQRISNKFLIQENAAILS